MNVFDHKIRFPLPLNYPLFVFDTKLQFFAFINLNKLCYRYMVKPENSEIGHMPGDCQL